MHYSLFIIHHSSRYIHSWLPYIHLSFIRIHSLLVALDSFIIQSDLSTPKFIRLLIRHLSFIQIHPRLVTLHSFIYSNPPTLGYLTFYIINPGQIHSFLVTLHSFIIHPLLHLFIIHQYRSSIGYLKGDFQSFFYNSVCRLNFSLPYKGFIWFFQFYKRDIFHATLASARTDNQT